MPSINELEMPAIMATESFQLSVMLVTISRLCLPVRLSYSPTLSVSRSGSQALYGSGDRLDDFRAGDGYIQLSQSTESCTRSFQYPSRLQPGIALRGGSPPPISINHFLRLCLRSRKGFIAWISLPMLLIRARSLCFSPNSAADGVGGVDSVPTVAGLW